MKFWKSILTLVLLAVWLPTTAHCGLEAFGLIPMDECCKEETQGNHRCDGGCSVVEDGGCSVVEDGGVKTEFTGILITPPEVLEVMLELSELLVPCFEESESAVPPFQTYHLPQFVIQTALPIRGPSSAS